MSDAFDFDAREVYSSRTFYKSMVITVNLKTNVWEISLAIFRLTQNQLRITNFDIYVLIYVPLITRAVVLRARLRTYKLNLTENQLILFDLLQNKVIEIGNFNMFKNKHLDEIKINNA